MPKITDDIPFNGFTTKVQRLGLNPLVDEVRSILTGFQLSVLEEKNANGAAEIRVRLDKRFEKQKGWRKIATGDIDWQKCREEKGIRVCIGVELQVSGRSDMIAVDIIHLRKQIKDGFIDAGIIVVPDETLGKFLTDRTPTIKDAKKHIDEAGFHDSPILLLGFQHDGPGPALPKRRTNVGRSRPKK